MKIGSISFAVALSFICAIAFAHPPSSIELTYNQTSQMLHVEINHFSRDLREHHIRKITVNKNDQEVFKKVFATQTSPNVLIQDIPINADPGDTIYLKAICSKAGYKEKSIVVPDEEPMTDETK